MKDYKQQSEVERKKALLLVIQNLPEREGEDALGLVNSVIKDGIKLPDVSVTEVEHKIFFREGYPGVVITTCASRDDKRHIMSNKSSLKDSTQYQEMMIDAHKDFQQCRLESSLHSIANVVRKDQLTVRGSQVWQVRHGEGRGRSQNDNTQWPLPGATTQPNRGR